MHLSPLACLPHLACLHLELGIADLAAIPPQVTELQLIEVDRIVLPPVSGTSVADRLLAVAESQGLNRLCLEAASGSIVFAEANHAPLELELSHLARLLAAGSSGRWRVQLSVRKDDVMQQQLPRLELTRLI